MSVVNILAVIKDYGLERNRTKSPSNSIEGKSSMQFGHQTKSNTERFCEFDARTKSNQIIKWNEIEQSSFDLVRLSSEIEL